MNILMKSFDFLFYKSKYFIYSLGFFGEYILILITCALIYYHTFYFFFYFFFLSISIMINLTLKNIIKEPRPSHPVKFLDTDHFSKNSYGNPSGHTQLVFFSFMYAYLVIEKITKLFMFSIIICIITIYQRYAFRNHTLKQLLYGAIVGLILAYLSYSITTYIKNKMI